MAAVWIVSLVFIAVVFFAFGMKAERLLAAALEIDGLRDFARENAIDFVRAWRRVRGK